MEAKDAPLTDDELDEWGRDVIRAPESERGGPVAVRIARIVRLVAEVRRLRALHYDKVLDDIGRLLEALGRPNVARPDSPQAVMQECITEADRLRAIAEEHKHCWHESQL